MFHLPRQLFHRQPPLAQAQVLMYGRPGEYGIRSADEARHPAMRGLNVSPVHGRHCICDRCAADGRAA